MDVRMFDLISNNTPVVLLIFTNALFFPRSEHWWGHIAECMIYWAKVSSAPAVGEVFRSRLTRPGPSLTLPIVLGRDWRWHFDLDDVMSKVSPCCFGLSGLSGHFPLQRFHVRRRLQFRSSFDAVVVWRTGRELLLVPHALISYPHMKYFIVNPGTAVQFFLHPEMKMLLLLHWIPFSLFRGYSALRKKEFRCKTFTTIMQWTWSSLNFDGVIVRRRWQVIRFRTRRGHRRIVARSARLAEVSNVVDQDLPCEGLLISIGRCWLLTY